MRKAFKNLRLGEKFYLPLDGKTGGLDLRKQLIKVSPIQITTNPPWETIKVTPNVITHAGMFNAVIIASPNDVNGYYDFVPDDTMVYPENLVC